MTAPQTVETEPTSVWRSLRAAGSAFVDNIGRFALANAAVVVTLAVSMALVRRQPIAVVLIVAVVPVAAGIGRMSARTVRGERANWGDFRAGLSHRAATTWTIGALVIVMFVVAGFNVAFASGGHGTLVSLSAVLSLHVAAAAAAVAAATWPLLLDPARDGVPGCAVVRQGLVVLAARPWTMIGVVVLEGLFTVAQVSVLATAFILPTLMQLVAAFVVVPWADRLEARRLVHR